MPVAMMELPWSFMKTEDNATVPDVSPPPTYAIELLAMAWKIIARQAEFNGWLSEWNSQSSWNARFCWHSSQSF
jgi:hypothetical protein